MMRRSSAQHGKLQKSWPLPWHHGMSNLTHVSRPFSCAAGLGAGGTDAIGLVLSVHLRASLDNFFSLRCFDFLRHNQIYQWDTPCTNIHSKYIYIYIYIHCIYIYIYICVCVSTSGFPIFLQGIDTYWCPSLHFLMISLQDLKLQVIFFQWWRTTEQMANRLSGQTVNMYLKKVDLAVFFLRGSGGNHDTPSSIGVFHFWEEYNPPKNNLFQFSRNWWCYSRESERSVLSLLKKSPQTFFWTLEHYWIIGGWINIS